MAQSEADNPFETASSELKWAKESQLPLKMDKAQLELEVQCKEREMGRLRKEVAGKVQAHEEMLKRRTDDMLSFLQRCEEFDKRKPR